MAGTMRTRSLVVPTLSEVQTLVSGYVSYDGVKTTSQTVNASRTLVTHEGTKTMTDYVTGGYYKLMSEGNIVNNDMTQTSELTSRTPLYFAAQATWRQNVPVNPKWTTRSLTGFGDPIKYGMVLGSGLTYDPPMPVPAVQEKVAEAFARMAATPMNAWVVAGEARETIICITKTLKACRSLVHIRGRDFLIRRRKHRMLRDAKDAIEELPSLWLHIRYGLRPLVYDLKGLLEVYQKVGGKARQRFTSTIQRETVTSVGPEYTRTEGYLTFKTRARSEKILTCQAGLLAEPTWENLTIADLLGTGSYIEAAWDLVPYSFVIDWFCNVAEVMSAWSPHAWIHPLATWAKVDKTTKVYQEVVPGSVTFSPIINGYPLVESTGGVTGGTCVRETRVRQRIAEPPRPIIPTINLRLGVYQGLDLLALARNFRNIKL